MKNEVFSENIEAVILRYPFLKYTINLCNKAGIKVVGHSVSFNSSLKPFAHRFTVKLSNDIYKDFYNADLKKYISSLKNKTNHEQ